MKNNLLINFDNFKKTWQVDTELSVNFTLTYSSGIFNSKNHDLLSYSENNRRVVVIDKNVNVLYGKALTEYFNQLKVEYDILEIDCEEINKNFDTLNEILDFFENKNLLRKEIVLAIGGGVLLDIVGFACSIYRRGVPYVKIPTTLLAIVDASVGSKVAINHFDRRNRLGAYYPPVATLIDKKFIKTQDERQISNGIAEILKIAIIKNEELFDVLEQSAEQLLQEKFQYGAVPVKIINSAITNMIEELAPNLWEKKLDRCVDFGHIFSPFVEMKNVTNMLHGEAVILDCLFSSCIAYNRKYITYEDLIRILNVIKKFNLPTFHKDFIDSNLLQNSLNDSLRHRNGNQYLPLPIQIGNYKIINDLKEIEIKQAIDVYKLL
jgi:3-dehydroquinate synthase